jgi:CDP-6-deoxy-D-xylo-4-hexulose-3-dehydrase
LYNFYLPGMNLRSTDLQAFIGLRAIDKLDMYSEKRNLNFTHYLKSLKNNELIINNDNNNFISNFAFPIVNKNKIKIVSELQKNNVEVRPLIAGDMSKKPMWFEIYGKQQLPNCEIIDSYGFYIPNHQDLEIKDIDFIVNIINKYVD